jgi:WD40 repeat protein
MATRHEAIAIVAALLREHALTETLAALTRETGEAESIEGARAVELADKLRALKLKPRTDEPSELLENDPLMKPTSRRLPAEPERTITKAHVSNVLCVAFCGAGRGLVASGGADKLVALTPVDAAADADALTHRLTDHKAPILAVSAQPEDGSLLVSTAMDGRVCLHDVDARTTVGEWSDAHKKYALCAAWRDRDTFASCSSDGLVAAFRAGSGEANGGWEKMLELPLSRDHGVTSVGWALGSAAPAVLVASVQEAHSLRYYDCVAQRLWSVSLNDLDDGHVGFNAMHIAVHPSGKYLAVATDRQRSFVYEWGKRGRVRTLISDFQADEFAPAPRQAWDAEGRHLYIACGETTVAVWDVGMERQVGRLVGHSAIVRGIDAIGSAAGCRLATCSFDKTVRLWGE